MFGKRYHIIHSAKRETRNLGNPFRFQPRLPAHFFSFPRMACLAIVGVGAIFYWLFVSSAFAVERVKINSSVLFATDPIVKVVQDQLGMSRWSIASQGNIFAFDSSGLSGALAHAFALSNVYIKKNRPHEIVVTISEKPREAIWSTQGNYFAIDTQGIVLGAVSDDQIKDKIVIYGHENATPDNGAQIVKPETLSFIANVFAHPDIQSLRPQFFVAQNDEVSEIALKVGEGWRIYFDTTIDLAPQVENLKLTLEHAVPPEARPKLDYIDVRFGRRVYYKLK